jgi:hypothetical protein
MPYSSLNNSDFVYADPKYRDSFPNEGGYITPEERNRQYKEAHPSFGQVYAGEDQPSLGPQTQFKSPNARDYFTSRKVDPTLGGKLDPRDYIDDWEAKTMFNASKHDVDIARGGGPKLGSLAQKVLGDSGGITDSGEYVADAKIADPNLSIANAINKYGYKTVADEVLPWVANGHFLDSRGLSAFKQASKKYDNDVKNIGFLTTIGLKGDDVRVLMKMMDEKRLDKPGNPVEYLAVERMKIRQKQNREDISAPTHLENELEKNMVKGMIDYPEIRIFRDDTDYNALPDIWFKQNPDGTITKDKYHFLVTKENYKGAIQTLAKAPIVDKLTIQEKVDPQKYSDNKHWKEWVGKLGDLDSENKFKGFVPAPKPVDQHFWSGWFSKEDPIAKSNEEMQKQKEDQANNSPMAGKIVIIKGRKILVSKVNPDGTFEGDPI